MIFQQATFENQQSLELKIRPFSGEVLSFKPMVDFLLRRCHLR
jgi:hypothetical protein